MSLCPEYQASGTRQSILERKPGLAAGSAPGAGEPTRSADIVPSLEKPAEPASAQPQPERPEAKTKYTPANTEGLETHGLSQNNLDKLADHSSNILAMQDLEERLGVSLSSKNVKTSLDAEMCPELQKPLQVSK
ncbi:MAG: hypothetical protein ACHQ6U_13470 [Thermodesulfobacteriota bacterium]